MEHEFTRLVLAVLALVFWLRGERWRKRAKRAEEMLEQRDRWARMLDR